MLLEKSFLNPSSTIAFFFFPLLEFYTLSPSTLNMSASIFSSQIRFTIKSIPYYNQTGLLYYTRLVPFVRDPQSLTLPCFLWGFAPVLSTTQDPISAHPQVCQSLLQAQTPATLDGPQVHICSCVPSPVSVPIFCCWMHLDTDASHCLPSVGLLVDPDLSLLDMVRP